jgi:outer membrane immunogenic protein
MKKFLLGIIALVAIASTTASQAADLPVARTYKTPAYVPAWNWTGCYVGVHGGGGTLHDSWSFDRGVGGLAGGQLGCNYQVDWLVIGVEGEGWWSGLKAKRHFDNPFEPADERFQTKNKSDLDVALRVGIALDRSLIYGKAGVVWGRFSFDSIDVLNVPQISQSGSTTLSGILIGLGLEHALTSNWTAKIEYNYLGFGAKDVRINCTDLFKGACFNEFGGPFFIQSLSADKHIIKVGLNYLFNLGGGPIYTRY